MGIYAEYLDQRMSVPEIEAERKRQLTRISKIRGGRDLLVYAADLRKGEAPTAILYEDLLPLADQLSNLHRQALDVVLETPGGFGEVAEDIVRLFRNKYEDVAYIVPGSAKSAGTIIVMSGDEILLESGSSLGPIDAQLMWQGKFFSAEAFLKGLDKMKEECEQTQSLNPAYIPILQNIHPGEIQHADNALAFAKTLVREWLARYKFRTWKVHSSTGQPVAEEEKSARAEEIADELCDHSRWLSHGRSIKIDDLKRMRLRITDYSGNPELFDAIRRYHTLLQMTFESNIYKVFETPESQIYKFALPSLPGEAPPRLVGKKATAEVNCGKCQTPHKLQLNFEKDVPLEEGCIEYPADDVLKCKNCGFEMNLGQLRRQLESETRRKVVLG